MSTRIDLIDARRQHCNSQSIRPHSGIVHDTVDTQRQATRHTKVGLHGGGSEFSCRPSAVKRGFPRADNGQHWHAKQSWVTLGE